jgi:urea transport system substrate-binding protein
MPRYFGRRQFIIYGSTAAVTGIGLKACNGEKVPSSPANRATPGQTEAGVATQPLPAGKVKVGLLHSLSGLMAISEIAIMDAEQFAIDQINANGGVLGKHIEAIVEDGASDWPTFAEKADKLINQDKVSAVFGGWTPGSYQAVLPVLEASQQMLWYPAPQIDQACSQLIIYGGAAPNQQVEPALDWLLENKGKQVFLIESQAEPPELTIGSLLAGYLKANGGTLVGEASLMLNHTEFGDTLKIIKEALPEGGIIFNRLHGESNLDFFKQLKDAGMNADQYPVMSITITEDEIRQIGADYLAGHYATWNYFQTIDTDVNQTWVADFKQTYGDTRVTSDPMATAYTLVHLWKQAVEQAGTLDSATVRAAAYGQTVESPGGLVTLQSNHHLSKIVRIGQVRDDGLFEIVWSTEQAIAPKNWRQSGSEPQDFGCNELKHGEMDVDGTLRDAVDVTQATSS